MCLWSRIDSVGVSFFGINHELFGRDKKYNFSKLLYKGVVRISHFVLQRLSSCLVILTQNWLDAHLICLQNIYHWPPSRSSLLGSSLSNLIQSRMKNSCRKTINPKHKPYFIMTRKIDKILSSAYKRHPWFPCIVWS
jgi:hypothetical protein